MDNIEKILKETLLMESVKDELTNKMKTEGKKKGLTEGTHGVWEDDEDPQENYEDEDEYGDGDGDGYEDEPGIEGEYEDEDPEDSGYTMDEDEALNALSEMSREDVRSNLQNFSKKLDGLIKSVREGYKAIDILRKIGNDNEFLKAGEAITALELIKRGVDPKKARGKNALKGTMKQIASNAGTCKVPMEDVFRKLAGLKNELPL